MNFIEKHKKFFWDTDPTKIDLKLHHKFIIERILESGNIDSVKELFGLYSKETITDILINSRRISKKTGSFWKSRLNITHTMKCFEMQSNQEPSRLWT